MHFDHPASGARQRQRAVGFFQREHPADQRAESRFRHQLFSGLAIRAANLMEIFARPYLARDGFLPPVHFTNYVVLRMSRHAECTTLRQESRGTFFTGPTGICWRSLVSRTMKVRWCTPMARATRSSSTRRSYGTPEPVLSGAGEKAVSGATDARILVALGR